MPGVLFRPPTETRIDNIHTPMTDKDMSSKTPIAKAMILVSVFLGSFALECQAKTLYISDELRVPLRTGPGGGYRIIHQGLPSGTELNLIESNNDGWSHITSAGGLDGWLESQYLTDQLIARDRLARVESRLQVLEKENAALKKQLGESQTASRSLESELQATQVQSRDAEAELTKIRQISANSLNLHEQNQELLKRNRMLQSEIDVLTAVREQLEDNETQRWFMYGGLAVFLGAMLTVLIPRLKPRKRFSEWA